MDNKSFKIEGMTCSACANRVERAISKLEGVEKANVNFATETLTVDFNKENLNSQMIEEAVVKAGYGVKKNVKTYNFKIEGMT
ncbi:MAG TPA: heavy metal translocating P-type ATPase, partial [Clostridium sp.]|nr:heavy metal translocating P-type ATPase [Clostridium sp.]